VYHQYSSADGLSMIQLHAIRPPYELFPLPNTKPWRRTVPGICLEGICTNKIYVAYQHEVIIAIGFKKFDVLLDINAKTVGCPMCFSYVSIRKLAFNYCQWRWYGIKQLASLQPPNRCNKDWSQPDDYSVFDDDIHGAVSWRQLVIEAKPLPPLINSNK
jgi:hypothetical protein